MKEGIENLIVANDPLKNVRSKINITLEEIGSLKKDMRQSNYHKDAMLSKTYTAVKQVEENLEGILGEMSDTIDDIKKSLDGLNEEFFTSIFEKQMQTLLDKLA